MLHITKYQDLSLLTVDTVKLNIQRFLSDAYGRKVFKSNFYFCLHLPPTSIERPYGVPHRLCFDSHWIEVINIPTSLDLSFACDSTHF